MGKLSIMSLAFAAIVLGIIVDYAALIIQEARQHPDASSRALRRFAAPGIIAGGCLIAFGTLDELLARLERSYRLSYRDPLDPSGDLRVRYCKSFAAAQQQIARELLSEYSIARASLEDVYFTLTGEQFEKDDREAAH